MSSNISDIIAMGGKPKLALIALAIPHTTTIDFIKNLYEGFLQICNNANCSIIGGDISTSQQIVISITLYGEANHGCAIRRDGAKTGDTIYLTGTTGSSLAGLEILQHYSNLKVDFPSLIKKHCQPTAQHKIIEELKSTYKPTAMIDISDGLISELNHISSKSNKGYTIELDKIPYSDETGVHIMSLTIVYS